MNGVIILDKPAEFTSFDALAVMRGITKQRKIGHCGTLDPNATGVLPILLGVATKAQDIIPNHNKEYVAELRFGIVTDTLDIWGKVLGIMPSNIDLLQLQAVLPKFRGDIMQTPPMYSAIQINGQRLYDLARKGIEVDRESRQVTIYKLDLLDFNKQEQTAKICVVCSKGTYIRSLIDDIGRTLGVGAIMTSLRRTCACGYNEGDALTLAQFQWLADNGKLSSAVRPIESLFYFYDKISVSDKQAVRFNNGGELDLERTSLRFETQDNKIVRVNDQDNNFLGLGITNQEKKVLKIYKIFKKN